ncbi:MAG: hypothetical protein QF376_04130 [Anaerolineales bacterium]|nr:hypothetical protein [Anaerolineales bacterium]
MGGQIQRVALLCRSAGQVVVRDQCQEVHKTFLRDELVEQFARQ